MRFFLRGLHISFWLFAFWVALRVWELGFEISPLPAWLLPIFVFFVLFGIVYLLARRLFKHCFLDRQTVIQGVLMLVLGAFAWEVGLTLWMNRGAGFWTIFTWRFLVGMAVQVAAIVFSARRLKQKNQEEEKAKLDLQAILHPGLAERIKEQDQLS